MRALADALFAALAIVVTLAIVGDRVSAVISTIAGPLCVLFVGLIVVRLVWSYTSRW